MIQRRTLKGTNLLILNLLVCLPPLISEKKSIKTNNYSTTLKHSGQGIEVFVAGKFFARYNFGILSQPIIWPVEAPGGIKMLRDWPIKKDAQGEAKDHPHHRAIFIGHQSVNGVNYWHNQYENSGRIEQLSIIDLESGGEEALIKTHNAWKDKAGIIIANDIRTLRFGGDEVARYIELELEIIASKQKDLVFEEFKDGFVGMRTHPDLRLTPNSKRGVKEVFGEALNSEGVRGKSIWGKRANWVHYFGEVDGKRAGVAFFSHPDNSRSEDAKSWWHARDYGLISANPFAPLKFGGDGERVVLKGTALRLRYRLVFHSGSPQRSGISERFASFAKTKN